MYIKEIYQDWELHQDATQLEIKYKFFVKLVDVLNVKTLIHQTELGQKQISNPNTIKKWQENRLKSLISDFLKISDNYDLSKFSEFNFNNEIEKSIFIAIDILNILKKTNYKSNDVEAYYEPRLFSSAQSKLSLAKLQEWSVFLISRLKECDVCISDTFSNFQLEIKINNKNINNVMWYIENLNISLNEIATWFNKQLSVRDYPPSEKAILINIMNHFIVFYLTDFYVKYNHLWYKDSNYVDFYNWCLFEINKMINEGKFAIQAYKQMSIFLSKILVDKYIGPNSLIIDHFMNIIKVSCSKNNQEYFYDIIFKLYNERTDRMLDKEASKYFDDIEFNQNHPEQESNYHIENKDENELHVSNPNKSLPQRPVKTITLKQNDDFEDNSYTRPTIKLSDLKNKKTSSFNSGNLNYDYAKDDDIQAIINKKTSSLLDPNKTVDFNNHFDKDKGDK